MSGCAGAVREHRQTDSQAGQWKRCVPWTSCSVYEWGLARGQESALLVSVTLNSLVSVSSNFSGSLGVFLSSEKFAKFATSGFCDHCLKTGCESVIRWWEKCIVYTFFCIFIIITLVSNNRDISIISSISFVVLLNCLYLNPWVSHFVHFSSPSRWEEGEGWASGCLVRSCWLLG